MLKVIINKNKNNNKHQLEFAILTPTFNMFRNSKKFLCNLKCYMHFCLLSYNSIIMKQIYNKTFTLKLYLVSLKLTANGKNCS